MAKKKKRESIAPARRKPVGEVPGTIAADPTAVETRMRVIAYGPQKLEEKECSSLKDVEAMQARRPNVLWLDVTGLGNGELIKEIGEHFELHRLALEDVVSTHQRPKAEPYPETDFIVLRMAREEADAEIDIEQVSFFLGEGFVITFQEREGDVFDPVRRRIRDSLGRIRSRGSDYLLYALVDAVVDNVFPIVEGISERLEDEEEIILREPDDKVSERLYEVRRKLIHLRRAVWPLREVLSHLQRSESGRMTDDTKVYLRDVEDHAVQLVDLLESEREVVGTLMDVYLSQVSHRMNEVMKVLTIMSTIFIPLGFLAGLYGMNFDTSSPYNLPELEWAYGYPALIGFMLTVAIGMLFYFRRKGWL
ncbi:MAG: magnesium and cobalt transport protein CorA [Sandaracinus sp.]|nr:magnesium and cobalt transport protein CorA [Sandaracinus sp.]